MATLGGGQCVWGGGGVGLGWVGSQPLPGVACTAMASFPAGRNWTRVTRMSGHKGCRTVDSPQTTPSARLWEIPLCLFVPLCTHGCNWGAAGSLGRGP